MIRYLLLTVGLSVCLGGLLQSVVAADSIPLEEQIKLMHEQIEFLQARIAHLEAENRRLRSKQPTSAPTSQTLNSMFARVNQKRKTFLTAAKSERARYIKNLRLRITHTKSLIRTVTRQQYNSYVERTAAVKPRKDALKLLYKELRRLSDPNDLFVTSRFYAPLAVGQSALLQSVKVFQVSNRSGMLGEIPVRDRDDVLVWFSGVDTSGMVDGGWVKFDSIFCIVGTRKYRTVIGGSKTVFVLEPISSILGK